MNKLDKKIMLTAAILGAVTIGIGAFGAHGLKELVDAKAMGSFETGVRYQMYHVLALFALGAWGSTKTDASPEFAIRVLNTKKWAFRFFFFGMVLFSGSLYLLALKEQLSFPVQFLGPVTPVGGLLLVIGWMRLAFGIFKLKSQYSI